MARSLSIGRALLLCVPQDGQIHRFASQRYRFHMLSESVIGRLLPSIRVISYEHPSDTRIKPTALSRIPNVRCAYPRFVSHQTTPRAWIGNRITFYLPSSNPWRRAWFKTDSQSHSHRRQHH
jgi:hypothetical protein